MFAVVTNLAQTEDGGELEDGETVDIEVSEVDTIEFIYDGEEGDVITIIVEASDSETDTRLILLDEDGDEVATDDFSGSGLNPALVRIVLPEDGEYTILIEDWDELELDDSFEVTLYEVDLLDLNDDAQTVEIGDEIQLERMILEVEEDETYFLFFRMSDVAESVVYVDLLFEDDFFAATRVSFTGTDTYAFAFVADDDGVITLELAYSSFDGDEIDITVEVDQPE